MIPLSKTSPLSKEVFLQVIIGMNDLEKAQKTTAQDLSNFKISTQNSFETINDVVESRDGASKPQSLAEA